MWRRPSLIERAIRRRFAVTLVDNGGTFSGILAESDDTTWVFEHVETAKGEPAAGRLYIDRFQVAYLQEVNT